jgi:hypothetical protein
MGVCINNENDVSRGAPFKNVKIRTLPHILLE